jgi:Fe-S-cluster-containing hydrogenase component 2
MKKIELQIHKCVNTFSKLSTCNSCLENCPTNAFSRDENSSILQISQTKCIECGSCLSSCPNEAISLQKFSPINFIFSSLESSEKLSLDCKNNIPCISALSPEELISLLIFKKDDVNIELSHCANCEIFPTLFEKIENLLSETELFREALGVENRLLILNEKKEFSKMDNIPNLEKREILNTTLFQKKRDVFNSDELSKIERGVLPNRRKLFLMALKRLENSSNHILEGEDLSFISNKEIDQSCTNCQICYRICPTKALRSDYKNSFIEFNVASCIKCNLCHDVCETSSINIVNFQVSELKSNTSKKLIEFSILKCHECDTYFTKVGNSNLCKRCQIEEDEANELWGF